METTLQNLLSLWANLSNSRRGILVGATLAMFLAILGLAKFAGQADMALLYSGLDNASAGAVVTALDQQAVAYEIRGDAIYVDQSKRDGLRMTLAAQGLPATGGNGYELLDSLSGFGTTSQMFDAAYWRAKEGELARTVLALPEVRSARVHVAEAPTQLFQDQVWCADLRSGQGDPASCGRCRLWHAAG
jgi:flagellar M-ring protein FliF